MKLLKESIKGKPIKWTTDANLIANEEEREDFKLAKKNGLIVEMKPLDFIRKTVENDTEYKSLLNQLEKDTVDTYVRGQQYTFACPYVKEDDPTFHDGRHRAYIAYKNGEETIPAILFEEKNTIREEFTEEEKDRIIKDFLTKVPCVEVKVDEKGRWILPVEEKQYWDWDEDYEEI